MRFLHKGQRPSMATTGAEFRERGAVFSLAQEEAERAERSARASVYSQYVDRQEAICFISHEVSLT
jgi:hypothetical protein